MNKEMDYMGKADIDKVFERFFQHYDAYQQGDSCRLFHGRGQCYQGLEFLTIDWYSPVVFICIFKEVPDEWLSAFETHLNSLLEGFSHQQALCVVLQKRYLRGAPSDVLWGSLPESVYAKEDGWQFELSFCKKQNIGYFLDMAPGRAWVKIHAEGRRVLNLFSYTCSFSIAALSGGAKQVINLDMSRGALEVGKNNHRINAMGNRMVQDVHFLSHDLFRSWGKLKRKGPFDLIIVDPPSYQRGSFVADKDYAKVLKRLPSLLSEKGDVLLCLNAPYLDESFLPKLIEEHAVPLRFVERLASREDFPEDNNDGSLKVMHFMADLNREE